VTNKQDYSENLVIGKDGKLIFVHNDEQYEIIGLKENKYEHIVYVISQENKGKNGK
jgi:hypothetical protein